MKFHQASFLWQFKRRFDISFDVYECNRIVYLITENKYFTIHLLKDLVIEAMIDALDAPFAAPDGPRQRSLLDAPLDTHIEALKGALSVLNNYISFRTISTSAGERFEWQVDLKRLQEIVTEVRRIQDVELAKKVIRGDLFVSYRLLEKKLLHLTGVAFSQRRLYETIDGLQKDGAIAKGNGHLRTHGREVLL